MPNFDRIVLDPLGVPYIRDTGIAVWQVTGNMLEAGTISTLLSQYPQLSQEDLEQAALYGLDKMRRTMFDLSSELRTPIAVLKTSSYLLSRYLTEGKAQERTLQIGQEVEYLSEALDQLSNYPRLISFSEHEIHPIPFGEIFSQIRKVEALSSVPIEIAPDAEARLVIAPPALPDDLPQIMLSKSTTHKDIFKAHHINTQIHEDSVEITLYSTYNHLPNSPATLEDILLWAGNPITRAAFTVRQYHGEFDLLQREKEVIVSLRLLIWKPAN